MKALLDECFRADQFDSRLNWSNPPVHWELHPGVGSLEVQPAANTDFWQATHYGFRADNGHVLGLEVRGDVRVTTRVAFDPIHQYDQAGLMIRLSPECWIKTSVEHELTGPAQLGVVVTSAGFSDWSLQDMPAAQREIELRLSKEGQDLAAEWRLPDQEGWRLLRMAHWHADPDLPVRAGLYACSPKGAGFKAWFKNLQISADGPA